MLVIHQLWIIHIDRYQPVHVLLLDEGPNCLSLSTCSQHSITSRHVFSFSTALASRVSIPSRQAGSLSPRERHYSASSSDSTSTNSAWFLFLNNFVSCLALPSIRRNAATNRELLFAVWSSEPSRHCCAQIKDLISYTIIPAVIRMSCLTMSCCVVARPGWHVRCPSLDMIGHVMS